MSVNVEKRVFNVDEFYKMAEVGIFNEDDRVELIEGEIINMCPIGSYHIACVNRFTRLLVQKAGDLAIVNVQNPIRLDNLSEPQPDISLVAPRTDFYQRQTASASDVLLLVEVADSSLDFGKKVKIPLYARAGIPEVWLAVLAAGQIIVYSQPAEGVYRTVRILRRGETLSPEKLPYIEVLVDEILGPEDISI